MVLRHILQCLLLAVIARGLHIVLDSNDVFRAAVAESPAHEQDQMYRDHIAQAQRTMDEYKKQYTVAFNTSEAYRQAKEEYEQKALSSAGPNGTEAGQAMQFHKLARKTAGLQDLWMVRASYTYNQMAELNTTIQEAFAERENLAHQRDAVEN